MSTDTTAAYDLALKFTEVFNERDDERRRAAIAAAFTPDTVYTDPDWAAMEGHEGIDSLTKVAHEKLGDLVFAVRDAAQSQRGMVLSAWTLGVPGSDTPVATGRVVLLVEDGRIARADNFFDASA
ncbi:nuclear transport factor 2 family protein [Streptomyces colonosanans]|uniref:SnoaL-like domain-containing protein n=1 Tax=Streptomyces colonosanans TaxID=1428652 RepID=A0A1S2NVB1_9ACTN|nr:nuclear transport factor 2 family protein [Streptomyces colonosanans]OIJ84774.1 hypothetical protein BIV24_30230 [Streptomyces colonosanans]